MANFADGLKSLALTTDDESTLEPPLWAPRQTRQIEAALVVPRQIRQIGAPLLPPVKPVKCPSKPAAAPGPYPPGATADLKREVTANVQIHAVPRHGPLRTRRSKLCVTVFEDLQSFAGIKKPSH